MYTDPRQRISRGFDVRLIAVYLALIIIGWLAVFSSSYDPHAATGFFDFSKPYCKQLIWMGASILLAVVLLLIESRIYQYFAYHIYVVCILIMVAVLFVGTEISGAKAWIKIGSFSIQPTEFAKCATALALAKFLNEGKTVSERKNIWFLASIFLIVPIVITILQHDAGSALVFLSFIILFYREGLNQDFIIVSLFAALLAVVTLMFNEVYSLALLLATYLALWIFNRRNKKRIIRYSILLGVGIALIFAVNLAYEHILEPHQKQRIESLFGRTSDPSGIDFNITQSKIAIGSGRLFGKGIGNGTQTKYNFVPEQSTDFVFCGIGEEMGFMGSLLIFGLFGYLIFRIITLSEKQRNPFVKYYGYGIASVIFFHFVVNIGMTIGLVPVIGIPLPFISYGGSSLLSFTTMLFIFIKLNES
ncbi:MAG: rod shape-determining protein RodA [Bacteroidales bacterium]|nr:rod shape-determining protein RodA [Bacteroidales bacterium]